MNLVGFLHDYGFVDVLVDVDDIIQELKLDNHLE